MELLIKGGTVVTATESFPADVAVDGGKIVAIGRDLAVNVEKVVDAPGKLVLPGALDAPIWQCRLEEPFQRTAIWQVPELLSAEVLLQFLIIRYSIRGKRF